MRKARVIIANDSKELANFEKKYIEHLDSIEIIGIATNSNEEIQLIEKYNPDIVITDIVRKNETISGMDIIKKYESNKNIDFILVTASEIQDILAYNNYVLPNNIIGYIKVPFDYDTISIEIEKIIIGLRHKLYDEDDSEYEIKYYSEKIINLFDKLEENEKEIAEKLNIQIKEQDYTRYEFDKIKQQLFMIKQMCKKKQLLDKELTKDLEKICAKFDALEENCIYK